MLISQESAPQTLDPEVVAYLDRMFRDVQFALNRVNFYRPRATLPAKPQVGELYYFSQAIGGTITGEGLWVYKSTGWAQAA